MTNSILTEIETILTRDVRPVLARHQGNVSVSDYTDGVLRIRFTGLCGGCPSASLTAEELIAEKLKEQLPEIRKVVLNTDVSDELIAQAKALLRHKRPRV